MIKVLLLIGLLSGFALSVLGVILSLHAFTIGLPFWIAPTITFIGIFFIWRYFSYLENI
jgi:hypothetical protein|tara:strand:- start:210 stop:386 length:177 start_codon:yes stop_codon:yes gene_type:complete